ncbi:DUF6428 family protein [Muriicola soli]|uniref:Uncharacterized protein n=1 Tax=Muriicola soli TaxID=2507538 RepID=A0A411E6M5_9FLAO|nr:DUF6428 family protein [Muriicola soli]QBA63173.1 hypothetical protein EQY75_00530 [Muriicola soli]
MNTAEFLRLLNDQANKELVFHYDTDKKIGANYHITEIKNTSIESVDCGGRADAWHETVIQLWESPAEIGKTEYLSTSKAKSILDRVHHIKPIDLQAPLKFEYGNNSFHTAQLHVVGVKAEEAALTVLLDVNPTLCKAGELCGVAVENETADMSACMPGSGCC